MTCGPKNSSSDKIEVSRIFDGGVVVTDGGAENASVFWAVMIYPGDNEVVGFFGVALLE